MPDPTCSSCSRPGAPAWGEPDPGEIASSRAWQLRDQVREAGARSVRVSAAPERLASVIVRQAAAGARPPANQAIYAAER